MPFLSLHDVNKVYSGGVQAVYDFNLDIEAGEFVVLVGSSGCGKSTTLRMIAGLESISSGDMFLQDRRVNDLSPSERGVAMVFQDYALYGNMTVYQNIGFSLTVRHKKSDYIHERVMEVSQTVALREYLNRYPRALSGGQKQRVAMGRAIARGAEVLLMDEPLSNLDAKLRQQTRKELAMLHRELRPTVVYVTHDHTEAMTLATRMVVMNDGRIQQIGTPHDIYFTPANVYTATFIGMPSMNLIHGLVDNGRFVSLSKTGQADFMLPLTAAQQGALAGRKELILGIRPENVGVELGAPEGDKSAVRLDARLDAVRLDAVVESLELLGFEYNLTLTAGEQTLGGKIAAGQEIKPKTKVKVVPNMEKAHFFDEKTGNRIIVQH
jgi:multiple sugar transport system ATP-binding protein